MVFTGLIGFLEGETDFCASPRDSSLDCVGEMLATNRMRTGAKYVASRAMQALST